MNNPSPDREEVPAEAPQSISGSATTIDLGNGKQYVQTDSCITFAVELGKAIEAGRAPSGFTVLLHGYTWADSEPTTPRDRRLSVRDLTPDEVAALAAGSASALADVITRAVHARNSPGVFSYDGTSAFGFETQ